MNKTMNTQTTRREFLKDTSRFAAVTALAGTAIPYVHAAGSDLIQVALIGCGGRGTGAAAQALSTKPGPIKLVAMADVFEGKLSKSYENLSKDHASQVDVPRDRKFIGFEIDPECPQIVERRIAFDLQPLLEERPTYEVFR